MPQVTTRLAALALLMAAAALPAQASGSASSASSEGGSASVGSSSTSIEKSSNSSSSKADMGAVGDYKIIEVAEAPARAGTVRLKLQPLAGAKEGEFFLYMPQDAYAQSHLAAGHVITARQHNYGLEFMRAQSQDTFFLVLNDEWYRELQTKVVKI
jgi:hypothetical protein